MAKLRVMEILLDGNVNLHVTKVFNCQDLRKELAKKMELGLKILRNVYVSLKHLSKRKKPAFHSLFFCYLKMFSFTASLSILLKYPNILTLVSDRMFFLVLCKLHSIRTLKSLCSNLGYQNTFLEFF